METFPKKLLSCNLKKKATSSSLDFVPSGKANGSQSYSKKVTFKEITSEENVLDDSFTGVPIESSYICFDMNITIFLFRCQTANNHGW